MKTATIRLELLRSGPAHNQLLSPLTPYIAVCGNRPAETVHLHSEHVDVVDRLDRLRYRGEGGASEYELRAAGEAVVRLLSSIRGLQEELALARRSGAEQIHLRLILSAQELAMLPFELAQAPSSLGGQDRYGFATPPAVVLTRESRRESQEVTSWPATPRVLVVMADPRGLGLPGAAHLLALRRALHPWLDCRGVHDREMRRARLAEDRGDVIEVLADASLDAVARRCREREFTHVHVLCHGAMSGEREARFGLALHDTVDPRRMAWVDGERLASAVRAGVATGRRTPSVLSLAVCDAGNVGTVLRPNASVAHALHEACIPLVIASQFPLTFPGSAIMTEVLYTGLLAGEDPLAVVARTRVSLLHSLTTTHDWAALTVYSSLPEEIDRLVRDARVESQKIQVERPLELLDRFGLEVEGDDVNRLEAAATEQVYSDEFLTQIEHAVAQARTKGPNTLMRYVSTYKRVAALGIPYRGRPVGASLPVENRALATRRIGLLCRAQGIAQEVFRKTRSAWSLVQSLALDMGVALVNDTVPTAATQLGWRRRWRTARNLLREERKYIDEGRGLKALDDREQTAADCEALLVQLWVLRPLVRGSRADVDVAGGASAKALSGVGHGSDRAAESNDGIGKSRSSRDLMSFVRRMDDDLRKGRGYSLLREMHRYSGWWFVDIKDDRWPGVDAARQRTENVIEQLRKAGVRTTYRPLRSRSTGRT